MMFSEDLDFELTTDVQQHGLMGEEYGRIQ